MEKKYEFTGKTIDIHGSTLHEIRSLVDIPGYISAGEIGGFIESERNLSHEGRCWVDSGSCVLGNAYVSEDTYIGHNVMIRDNAKIRGSATVQHGVHVINNAEIYGTGIIEGNILITDNAKVGGDVSIMYAGSIGPIYIIGDADIKKTTDLIIVSAPSDESDCMLTTALYKTSGGGYSAIRYAGGCLSDNRDANTVFETILAMLNCGTVIGKD